MLYLTLMETLQGRAEDRVGFQKTNYSVPPRFGINIREVYFLFGCYDGSMLWETADHRTAKELILRAARPAIYSTETLGAIPSREH